MPMRNLLLNRKECQVVTPSFNQGIKSQQKSEPRLKATISPVHNQETPGLFLLCGNKKKFLLWGQSIKK